VIKGEIVQKASKIQTAFHSIDRYIEYCMIAVAFFLPLSLNGTTFFLLLSTALWLVKMVYYRKVLVRSSPFDKLIGLLVLLSFASVWVSPDKSFSFYNYSHLMGRYVLIYYLVIHNVHSLGQIKRMVMALLGATFLVNFYGYYQYIFGIDISAMEWVDDAQFPDLKIRVFSTLKNPNLLASFLVSMIAIAGGLGFYAPDKKVKTALLLLVVSCSACLIITYSRGAWISLFAVLAAFGFWHNRKMFWLLLIVPLLVLLAHNGVLERVLSIANPTDTSSTLRLALWESTWSMISDHPLFGIGWGAYYLVYPNYDFFILNGTKIFHAHNMYLNIAAEIGIPAFCVFMLFLWRHAHLALKLCKKSGNPYIVGLMLGSVAAIFGLVVSGLTDYTLFNIQMSMLFWLLNALIVQAWRLSPRYSGRMSESN
jgi:putative inorganic carbon (hco3(-)) transporter